MRALGFFSVFLCLFAHTANAGNNDSSKWLFSISANYGAWDTSALDSDGRQTISFAQLAYDSKNWGASVSGAYASTSYKPSFADERFEVNTLTDTDISTYYNVKAGKLTIRGGLDLRLPSGKSSYSEGELGKIITDDLSQDLMLINTYGGGTNVTPNVMFVYKFTRLTMGLGAKYDFRGGYDYSGDTPDDNLDPGDSLLTALNGVYALSRSNFLLFTFTYSHSENDKSNGEDIFRSGDVYAGEFRILKQFGPSLTLLLSASYKSQEKNELLGENNSLSGELANSNNNTLEFYLNTNYRLSKQITLNGLVGYKKVGANGYGDGDSLYDAGRDKFYVEPGVSWYFSNKMYVTGKVRYSNVNDEKDASSEKDAQYDVVNVDLNFVRSF